MALKIKIEDTVVFQQTSLVLGASRAKIELFKASKTWDADDRRDVSGGKGVRSAFMWCNSVQGRDFWERVDTSYWKITKGE